MSASATPASTAAATGPFESWLETGAGADDLPGWLATERTQALTRVRTRGVPTSKSEGWRYTGLRNLIEAGFRPAVEPPTAVDGETLAGLAVTGLDAHRIVLVNGRFMPALSNLEGLPKGARIGGLRETLARDPDALEGLLTRLAGEGPHIFTSLNTAGLDDGLVMLLERGVMLERPLELLHLSVGLDGPQVAQPRHVIGLGDGARAELIERYVSLGQAPYCTNAVTELALGRDAVLTHQRLQLEGSTAFHLSGVFLRQDRGSHYLGTNIGLGGAWARTDLVVRFIGEHAECDLQGLYLAGDRQLIDYHMDVNHGLPQCRSRENFKGILYGKGRAVFDGLVYVEKDAQKTDAEMSNRNLILSPNAEVDTKPQLEIYADDVKCSHGTTVGQIEPELLFYLRSRGISAPMARRMLCLGFAGEIIEALGNPALTDHIAEEVGSRLEQSPA
jgi:Fe-S cluster assembly protein SufD